MKSLSTLGNSLAMALSLIAVLALALILFLASTPVVAADQPGAPPIHPELAAHTAHFEKKVYRVGDTVYSAVGYSLGNVIMIEGPDGLVIVDTGTHPGEAAEAWAALRKFSDKPVKAIVYTHFHPDHWGGVKAIVDEADVHSGVVRIFAHRTLVDNVIHQGGVIGPILAMRSGYSFGLLLSDTDRQGMNDGIGPKTTPGTSTFIRPTDLVDDRLDVEIAGIRMTLLHVPSEAPDEIAVYLPATGILMSGEAIQGPTLPNIHSLRGTKFRDPLQWYKSLDRLRALGATHLVPSHGQPIYGADKVEEVLRMTRDGIQYIHDQTLRLMNQGMTPDELANAIMLPPYLAGYAPYLREYYGSVKHTVRQIYNGYLGWFAGDPVDLDPVPRVEASGRYVALMGGRGMVLAAAQNASDAGDAQWAAELATHLVRIDQGDTAARQVKAAALRALGYASININWRNWYLTAAQELEGGIDPLAGVIEMAGYFSSPDIVNEWPLAKVAEGLGPRLDPAKAGRRHAFLAFDATDTGEVHAVEIRSAVVQFHGVVPAVPMPRIAGPRLAIIALIMGQTSLDDLLADGALVINGDVGEVRSIMALFDAPIAPIHLTLR